MKRREFLGTLGGAASMPFAARAQQKAPVPLVGFLNSASRDTYYFNANSFREGLRQESFIDGENVRIEERWAGGNYDLLPELAKELAVLNVRVIAATGDVASARAAQNASSDIPVVFTIGADPVRFGLVQSMNRPGGHVTGVSLLSSVLGAKRVELLHELAPKVERIGLLINPSNPNADTEQKDVEAGANRLGLKTIAVQARNAHEIDEACAELERRGAESLVTATDPILLDCRAQIVAYAARRSIPAIYYVQQFAAAGGLLSYGPSISWMYSQAGAYVAQILKGGRPADMPVMQPTKFELVVQRQDRKGARSYCAEYTAGGGRRGDRIEIHFAAVHESGCGTSRTWRDVVLSPLCAQQRTLGSSFQRRAKSAKP